eukprot:3630737-Rhodomonas_salina.1
MCDMRRLGRVFRFHKAGGHADRDTHSGAEIALFEGFLGGGPHAGVRPEETHSNLAQETAAGRSSALPRRPSLIIPPAHQPHALAC